MPSTERLFLAINLPGEAKEAIAHVQQQVKEQLTNSKVSWVAVDNFHITLHFLGNVEIQKREELISGLRVKEYPEPFELVLSTVSAFPDKKRPGTIYVETKDHTGVLGLHKRTADVIANLGYELDHRPWQAHVTVGRVTVQSEVLKPEEIEVEPTRFAVSSFALMRSTLSPEGSSYEIIAEFPL